MDQRIDGLTEAARTSLPVIIRFHDSFDASGRLESGIEAFLREAGQGDSAPALYYCARELAANAVKANAKRIFFAEKKLSLDSAADYEKGMRAFRQVFSEDYHELVRRADLAGLKASAELRLDGDSFTCVIRNSAVLTETEAERISDRLRRVRAFVSHEDVLSVIDSTEGAGLGLITLGLVLKKLGLPPESFSIGPEGGETVARLHIPVSGLHKERLEELSLGLVKYIENLPALPEGLHSLLEELADEDVDLGAVSNRIAADPALTAYLLKVANSAAYQLAHKVATVRAAMAVIGLRGVKNILLQYGVTLALGSLPPGAAELWQRSNLVAFCARYLALRRRAAPEVVDDALIGGVLHDMGMIVQYAVDSKAMKKIEASCTKRGIPPRLMEDIVMGLNHGRIGALLARKWNFPETLAQAIEYHHRPWAADPEFRAVVGLVYLADCLSDSKEGSVAFEQIDGSILADNRIRGAAELEALRQEIRLAHSEAQRAVDHKKRAG
jgi:HD-like signal output (HDOD) protein